MTPARRRGYSRRDTPPSGPAPLSREDVERALPRSAVERGEAYRRDGRVSRVRVKDVDDATFVDAEVQGSRRAPYNVSIVVRPRRVGGWLIRGSCTCPMQLDCKHIAATLLASIRDAGEPDASAVPPRTPPPSGEQPADDAADREPAARRETPALGADLAAWLDEVTAASASEGEAYPPEIRQRLIYVLELRRPAPRGTPRLVVRPLSVRLLKDGTFSDRVTPYRPVQAVQGTPARFLRRSDHAILAGLDGIARRVYYGTDAIALAGEEGARVLDAILATGRARWGDLAGPALARGEPRTARPRWRLGDDAAQHLEFDVVDGEPAGDARGAHDGEPAGDDRGGDAATDRGAHGTRRAAAETARPRVEAVCLAPPWYVDAGAGLAGPLDTGLSPRVAEALFAAPPVPAGREQLLGSALAARLPTLAALQPPPLQPMEHVAGPPAPQLLLTVQPPPFAPAWAAWRPGPVPVARLAFRYGAATIPAHESRDRDRFVRDQRMIEVERDTAAERAAHQRLRRLGLQPLPEPGPYAAAGVEPGDMTVRGGGDDAWLRFLARDAPVLRAEGWEVAVAPDFPVHVVRADGPLEARLDETTGIDWFDLDLGVVVDGERVDLTEPLVQLIATRRFDALLAGDPPEDDALSFVPLPDGRTLALPARRLWAIARALRELFDAGLVDAGDGTVRLSTRSAAELALAEEEAGAGVEWQGGERLRSLGATLRGADGIPHVEPPAWFGATLRDYQARGVDWLQLLGAAGLGGVLADDMGLGKTVQTLAHLAIERECGRADRPSLIVAPTSVASVWRDEAARFAPGLRVLVLHGPDRAARFDAIAEHDVVVTTYPLLSRDAAVLGAREWHAVVLDEAQTIKNPNAAVSRAARELRARQRFCLTGTPMENHLGDLWSLFAFVSPGFLGDRQHFNQQWRAPDRARRRRRPSPPARAAAAAVPAAPHEGRGRRASCRRTPRWWSAWRWRRRSATSTRASASRWTSACAGRSPGTASRAATSWCSTRC